MRNNYWEAIINWVGLRLGRVTSIESKWAGHSELGRVIKVGDIKAQEMIEQTTRLINYKKAI